MALRPQGAGAYYANDDCDIAIREICQRADEPLRDDMRLCHPGEPIYQPRRRGSSMLRALVISVALTGCGWGLLKTRDVWRPWADEAMLAATAALERATTPPVAGPQLSAAETMPPQDLLAEPPITKDVDAAPGAGAGEALPHEMADATGATEPANEAPSDAVAPIADRVAENNGGDGDPAVPANGARGQVVAEPLPQPKADPADPYEKRALAVGLHPKLSRVLLTRMSDADFRNAKLAITKAIAEVSDSDTLVWPKQRLPKLALFKVHFVAGAPVDCRRYVVVVTKDGWSTTAQPMERCGVGRPQGSSS